MRLLYRAQQIKVPPLLESLLGLSVADYWKPKHYIFDKDARLSQNGQKQPPGGEA